MPNKTQKAAGRVGCSARRLAAEDRKSRDSKRRTADLDGDEKNLKSQVVVSIEIFETKYESIYWGQYIESS